MNERRESKQSQILKMLQQGERFTSEIARVRVHTSRLAVPIERLRKAGWGIDSPIITVGVEPDKSRVAEYSFTPEQLEQPLIPIGGPTQGTMLF